MIVSEMAQDLGMLFINAVTNKSQGVRDLREWQWPEETSAVAVLGTGPSAEMLKSLEEEYGDGLLIVGNQSSAKAQVRVITDPYGPMINKVRGYSGHPPEAVWVSLTVNPAVYRFFGANRYTFIHVFNSNGNVVLDEYNKMITRLAPEVDTYTVQAGQALNTAVELVC